MTTENLLSASDFGAAWSPGEVHGVEREGGVRLVCRVANPGHEPRATVILTHGLGEHSNRYGHVVAAFVARGWQVIAWDLRGHGRSSGVRGDVADYEDLIADLAAVVAKYASPNRPWFFFAHSLGGQITLRYLQEKQPACSGAVIASPWLKLAYTPPWWKVALARVAMFFWPTFVQSTGSRLERLSRDASHLASFPDLDLVHHAISARMYFALRTAGQQVLNDAAKVQVPLLLLHGDADPVTSHHATCELFEQVASADKTLRIYPGTRHETHNDLDRAQVIREITDWIEARVPAKSASG